MCAGQFIGNVPAKARLLPGRDTLRSGLHTWPSVPGFALRSVVQKQTCNLVLVDDLRAGLAGTDLSVYLEESWFKFFSLNLFYLFCVCVLFYSESEPVLAQQFKPSFQYRK